MTWAEEAALVLATAATVLALSSLLAGRRPPPSRSGPPPGALVPDQALRMLFKDGELQDWLNGPTLLLFIMPGCEPCHLSLALLRTVPTLAPLVRMAIIEAGSGDSNLREAAPAQAAWFFDVDATIGRQFVVINYPTSVLVWKGRVLSTSEAVLDVLGTAAWIKSESTAGRPRPVDAQR
jgi:hypothetical protein